MQQFLDRRSSLLLLLFCLPLLFFPKVNLLSFGQETAGFRLDDFILLGFCLVCFWATFSVRKSFSDIEITLFALVGFSIFSCMFNQALFHMEILPVKGSFFYALRLLEYFLFFYVGILASQFLRLTPIITAFFIWNFVLMVLQKLQIVGIFSVEGYIAKPDDRMLGIASFGSEIGLLLNLLFCFLIYPAEKNVAPRYLALSAEIRRILKTVYPYFLLLVFVVLVVLSGARMAILALFLSFIISLKHLIRWRDPSTYILPGATLFVGFLLMLFFLYNASGIVSRSKGLFSFANIELISTVWDNISLDYDPIGRESVQLGDHDASWWMRIHKWCYVLKLYWNHPECWLQGLGPGVGMAALDGGFLRIFTEVGVVGSLLYARLFYLMARQTPQLRWMMFAFLLNMVFFDVYLAYKPMSLLFFIVGYSCGAKESIKPQRCEITPGKIPSYG